MTFFADAGIRWPNFEPPLRSAAIDALGGASQLYKLMQLLEVGEPDEADHLKEQVVSSLQKAASVYNNLPKDFGDRPLREDITTNDLLEAGISPQFFFDNYPFRRTFTFLRTFRDAYGWIARDLEDAISDVRALESRGDSRLAARRAFSAMAAWEKASTLGRLLAVLNRKAG
jgi:hypothetical protein